MAKNARSVSRMNTSLSRDQVKPITRLRACQMDTVCSSVAIPASATNGLFRLLFRKSEPRFRGALIRMAFMRLLAALGLYLCSLARHLLVSNGLFLPAACQILHQRHDNLPEVVQYDQPQEGIGEIQPEPSVEREHLSRFLDRLPRLPASIHLLDLQNQCQAKTGKNQCLLIDISTVCCIIQQSVLR